MADKKWNGLEGYMKHCATHLTSMNGITRRMMKVSVSNVERRARIFLWRSISKWIPTDSLS